MTVKDKYVDVRYHKKWFTSNIVKDTKLFHINLKGYGKFRVRKSREYDNFKEYYNHISWNGRYRMEC